MVATALCGDARRATLADGYVMIRCSFRDLQRLLDLAAAARLKSPLYPTRMPRNLEELLFDRRPELSTEMAQLCLLPVTQQVPRISYDLGGDIILLWASDHPLPERSEKTPPK